MQCSRAAVSAAVLGSILFYKTRKKISPKGTNRKNRGKNDLLGFVCATDDYSGSCSPISLHHSIPQQQQTRHCFVRASTASSSICVTLRNRTSNEFVFFQCEGLSEFLVVGSEQNEEQSREQQRVAIFHIEATPKKIVQEAAVGFGWR